MSFPRDNNIGLLRLLFALQVAVAHSLHYIDNITVPYLENFPGVPAFFFISGFLIYASYEHCDSLRSYAKNRFLRLYPGLFVVSTVSLLLLIFLIKGIPDFAQHWPAYLSWYAGEITVGHLFTPDLFRDVGVGAINSPLWTITVEILFYCAVPILFLIEKKSRYAWLLCFALSFALYVPIVFFSHGHEGLGLLLTRTPLVWGWMFGLGILSFRYFDHISPYIRHFKFAALPLIALIMLDRHNCWLASYSNDLGLCYFLCYGALILYVAFALPVFHLPFDLSYGMYVWNLPVINLLLFYHQPRWLLALVINVFLALISWYAVEKPALHYKKVMLKSD